MPASTSSRRGACLALAVAVLSPLAAAPAAATPATPSPAPVVRQEAARAAAPIPARPLPAQVDARPTYQGQVSCDPVDRPGTVALGRLLVDTYGRGRAAYSRSCTGSVSEHYDGRAIDWMLDAADTADAAVAAAALAWLTADGGVMARRLGVQYVIWNRQAWRAYAPERAWQPYTGSSPHTDHVHLSLTWDGALQRTSWWTGTALTAQDLGPCRVYEGQYAPIVAGRRTGACPPVRPAPYSSYPVYVPGQRHADVAVAQRALGVAADGVFGAGTRAAVLAYQARTALPRTGVLDKATWRALVPSSATPPRPPVVPTPPTPPVAPRPPAAAPKPSAPRVAAIPPVTTRATPHKKTRLRPGSRGTAVAVLQQLLRVPATGRYDAATSRAVSALQRRYRLAVTGRTDTKTWNRAELAAFPWLGHLGRTLRRGDTGTPVLALQRALRISADGVFGPATQRAVQAVQQRYGLARTGVTDPLTWRAIAAGAPR